jgi:chromosomal replication initiator protein
LIRSNPARDVMKTNVQDQIEAIQLAVAEHFGLSRKDLTSHSSKRTVAVPRQIAMYIAKQLTNASLPEIGRQFGGKHHTTVMHSIARIFALRCTDSALDSCIHTFLKELKRSEI